jgi:hypothetical protein
MNKGSEKVNLVSGKGSPRGTHWLFTIQFLPETYRNKIAFSIQTNFRSDKKNYRILKCHHFQKYEIFIFFILLTA